MRRLKFEGNITMDNKLIGRDLTYTHDKTKRLGRLKWTYLGDPTTSIGTGARPIDVSYGYKMHTGGLSGALVIYGSDEFSKQMFNLTFTYNIIALKFSVKGTIGRDRIDTRIYNPFAIFDILKPILFGKNS